MPRRGKFWERVGWVLALKMDLCSRERSAWCLWSIRTPACALSGQRVSYLFVPGPNPVAAQKSSCNAVPEQKRNPHRNVSPEKPRTGERIGFDRYFFAPKKTDTVRAHSEPPQTKTGQVLRQSCHHGTHRRRGRLELDNW